MMTDQWFLDLDGTRSGPYQTSEVMALIADGEVLPHHRISEGLKDTRWYTILDWRLEQARQVQTKRTAAPAPNVIPVSEPTILPIQAPLPVTVEAPVRIEIQSGPALSNPKKVEESPAPEDLLPPPIPTFSPGNAEFLKEVESLERAMEEQPVDGVRRDPMAEMFDLIQNTKQKREAKQLLSAQQASMDALDASKKSPGITRLVAICVAVSIFGLILGQWFQWFSSEPVASPPPPKSAAKTEPVETKAESKSETIDRSTEKMTIRSVVEKKPEVTHSKPATIHSKAPSPAESKRETEAEKESTEEASSPKKGDKDLEELRDLKKELQELKALKEELKNAPLNDEFGEGDLAPYPDNAGGSFGGSTGNYGNPQNYPNPGYNPNSGENPQNPGQPGLSPTPGSDLRY